MLGEVKIEDNEKFVSLEVSGETLAFTTIKDKLGEIATLAQRTGKNILIYRSEIPIHIGSAMEFQKYAELFDPTFKNKIALVYPNSMQSKDMKFFEISIRNKGFDFKLFPTKEEAAKWLNI